MLNLIDQPISNKYQYGTIFFLNYYLHNLNMLSTLSKTISLNSFKTFSTIYNMSYILHVSLTYIMFEVWNDVSLSQHVQKYYHWITLFKTFLMIYNTPLILKVFHWITKFDGIVSGFLGFCNGMVSIDVFKNIIVEFYVLGPFKGYIRCYHY